MIEPASDDGERKFVTVLFADVSGSMDLAEETDPELWRQIMQRFFALLADAVADFEGTVDKFTGDGIMAVFGAPVAHEDHAQRACYAALRMLDAVAEYAAELRRDPGLNFSTRIGIHSGEVVAGAIGAGAAYTAVGHTVGLAQRMEALAEPGRAYATESTAALVSGFLDLTDLGEFAIKGASRQVRVFEVAGVGAAHDRLDLARARGLSALVGRTAELGTLEAALERAASGDGAVAGIVGEPGVGKSRLAHELLRRAASRDDVEVFEAHAQSHGRAVPYWPILEMLRAFFAIGEGDSDQLTREKIAGRALLMDPEFAADLPLLFEFLGVPDPDRPLPPMRPEGRQRALVDVLCHLVEKPRRQQTLVLSIDDVHWLDSASAAMLAALGLAIAGTRTLVLLNYRPEGDLDWLHELDLDEVALEPLGPRATAELLRGLAGSDPSLDGLEEPIHERTAGNPLFVEEVVRDLAESGFLEGEPRGYRLARPIESAAVPASVKGILSARIDRLEPGAKDLLAVAAVMGKEMSFRSLARTADLESETLDERLGALISGGFLDEVQLYPQRRLAFRHPLTREVAYDAQLSERRAVTHAAAARAIIDLAPERLDELAGLVADHFQRGGEPREAARWYGRAAERAGHSQPREAMRLWQRATELADSLETDEEAEAMRLFGRMLQLEFAWRLGIDRETFGEIAAKATELAEASGDLYSLTLVGLLNAVPGTAATGGEWLATLREARALAERVGEPELEVAVLAGSVYAQMCAGDLDEVEATAEELKVLTAAHPNLGAGIVVDSPGAWANVGLGLALRERDRLEEAEARLEEAIAEAAEREDLEVEIWALSTKAQVRCDRGDLASALTLALRTCELTDRLGDVFSQTVALTALAYVRTEAGEHDEAIADIERADRTYREAMGVAGETESWRAIIAARAQLRAGRVAAAIERAELAATAARRREMRWQLPASLAILAEARAAAGDDDVTPLLDEAEELAIELGHGLTRRRIEAFRGGLAPAAL